MKKLFSLTISLLFIIALMSSVPLSSGQLVSQILNEAKINSLSNSNPIEKVQVFPSSQSIKDGDKASYTIQVTRSKDPGRQSAFSLSLSLAGDTSLSKQLDAGTNQLQQQKKLQLNEGSTGQGQDQGAQVYFNYPILRLAEGVTARNATVTLSGISSGIYSFNVQAVTLTNNPDQAQSNPARLEVLNSPAQEPEQGQTKSNLAQINHSPIAQAGLNQQVSEGTVVTLDASSSYDPDKGDILSYGWTQVANTKVPLVKLIQQRTDSPKATFQAPLVEKETALRFRLNVEDNKGGIATDYVSVLVSSPRENGKTSAGQTVSNPSKTTQVNNVSSTAPTLTQSSGETKETNTNENHAPIADLGSNIITNKNKAVSISLRGNDADEGDVMTFILTSGPFHGTVAGFDKLSGKLSYIPSVGFTGTDTLYFKIKDAKGAESNEGRVSVIVGLGSSILSSPSSSSLQQTNANTSNQSSLTSYSLSDVKQKIEERLALIQKIKADKLKETNGEKIANNYIIVLKNDITPDRALKISTDAKSAGATLSHQYQKALRGFSVTVPNDQALVTILNSSDVAYAEPDVKVNVFASTEGGGGGEVVGSQKLPTGVDRVDGDLSSAISGDGKGAVDADIAILDTGIDLTHPDLNVFKQVSFVPGITSGNDDNGHGTMVAGIAAAKDNNIGVVGVAPGARLWAIKVLDQTGSGSLSSVLQGIDYLTQHANEIDVADMSFGCVDCTSQILNTAISKAVSAGVTIVVAAGNSGKDASTFSPANHPDVIAVSAIADSDGKCGGQGPTTSLGADDTLASFSNYGSVIDMAAPGVNIYSATKGGLYDTESGTSMAAPHVAGTAALYLSEHPSTLPSQVRNTLQNEGSVSSSTCNIALADSGRGYFKGDKDASAESLLYVGTINPSNNQEKTAGSNQTTPATPNNNVSNSTTSKNNTTTSTSNTTKPAINGTLVVGNATSLGNITNTTSLGNTTGSENKTFSSQACCFCSSQIVQIDCTFPDSTRTNSPLVFVDMRCQTSAGATITGCVTLTLTFTDGGANVDPNNVNSVYFHILTASDPTGLTVTGRETDINTGIFVADVTLGTAGPGVLGYIDGEGIEIDLYAFAPNPGTKSVSVDFKDSGGTTLTSGSDSILLIPSACAPSSSGFADNSGIGSSSSTSSTDYYFVRKWGTSQSLTSNFNRPAGIAVSPFCDIYVADSANNRIQKFNRDGTFDTSWGSTGTGDGQFQGPMSIAVDSNNDVYVADQSNNRIQKFTSTGIFLAKWGSTGSGDGQFLFTSGIEAGIATGRFTWCSPSPCDLIFVSDGGNNRIQIFKTDGTFFGKFGTAGANDGQFNRARDVAVYSAGEGAVYVSDRGNSRIQKFNGTGSFISKWGNAGPNNGQFDAPAGIGLDLQSNVFVADDSSTAALGSGNQRIQKFDSNGNFLTKWGSYGSIGNALFDFPSDLATDNSGNVYVSDFFNDRIQIFDNGGSFITKWGVFSFSPTGGPWGIGLVPPGSFLYASDAGNNRVLQFSSTGVQISKLGGPGVTGQDGEFVSPTGVALNPNNGDVYVADSGNNRVQRFSATGSFIQAFSTLRPGDIAQQLSDLARYPTSGNIFVTDSVNGRVEEFDPSGNFLQAWTAFSDGSGSTSFSNPSSIGIDNDGNIYVSDTGNNRVLKFIETPVVGCPPNTFPTASATTICFVKQWGSQGSGNGQFNANYPAGLSTDDVGNVFVTDEGRVQKFNGTGLFLTKWGTPGPNDGQFLKLKDVAANPTVGLSIHEVYTAELGQRIQVFSPPPASISIDSVITTGPNTFPNAPPRWGIDTVTLSGATISADNGNKISVDWADGSPAQLVPLLPGGQWTASHIYAASAPASNPHNVVASLLDSSNGVRASSAPSPITVQKHRTSVSLSSIQDPVAGTLIAGFGVLTDTEYTSPLPVTQVSNKPITLGGTGGTTLSPNPAITVGISFLTSSPGPIPVEQCTNCPLDSGSGDGNNILIDLPVQGRITFPDGIKGVRLGLMGGTPLELKYTRGDNSVVTVNTEGNSLFPEEFEEGIKEIQIMQVGGSTTSGNARISHLTLLDHRASDPELVQMDFENLAACATCHTSPLVIEPGFYIAMGASPPGTPQSDLTVQAQFADSADPSYIVSNVEATKYNTITDTTGSALGDTGAIAYTGTRFNLITDSQDICRNFGGDADGDGICETWETAVGGHAYVKCPGNLADGVTPIDSRCRDGAAQYDLCFVDQYSGAWTGHSDGETVCPKPGHKDVFVEIDYMTGREPDPNAIKDVIKAFGNAPVSNVNPDYFNRGTINGVANGGITLHVVVDRSTGESPLTRVAPVKLWQDEAGATCANPPRRGADCDNTNDFRFIKEYHFGTASEHGLTGSVATAPTSRTAATNVTLDLKHYAYHYALFVSTWYNPSTGPISCIANPPSGPSSGQAEISGNDLVVSLGCNFGMTDSVGHTDGSSSVGTRDEQAGTFMHELGHNLGLEHGGGHLVSPSPPFGSSNYVKNCKPGYLSVMAYERQVPTTLVDPAYNPASPVQHDAIWSGSGGVKSFLDYSREDLKTTAGTYLNEGGLDESAGLKPTAGSSTGLLAGDKVRVIWGTPTLAVKTQRADVPVGGGSINWDGDANPSESAPPLPSVDINNVGISGCDIASTETTVTGPDDWHNLVLKFTNKQESQDGIFPNPRRLAELTPQQVAKANNEGQQFTGALQPINLDGSSIFQLGRTIPVKLQLRNPDGSFNTNALITFTAQRISSSISGSVAETTYTTSTTVGTLFHFDPATNTYIYNWSTKGLQTGTWAIRAIINYNTPQAQVLVGPGENDITARLSLR